MTRRLPQRLFAAFAWLVTAVLMFTGLSPAFAACGFDPNTIVHQRIDLSPTGDPPDRNPLYPGKLSTDGRYIAFTHNATNLVADDGGIRYDVFVHDRLNCTTQRVSVSNTGVGGNDNSFLTDISPDGRYVAFISYATNLGTGDTNGVQDQFIFDRDTNQTIWVSRAANGNPGNSGGWGGRFTADGTALIFESNNELVPANPDFYARRYHYNLTTGVLTGIRVPLALSSFNLTTIISDDGRYLAIRTPQTLVDDTHPGMDIFLYDVQLNQFTWVSKPYNGADIPVTVVHGERDGMRMSNDGRYIFFDSISGDLVAGDANEVTDIFRYDREADELDIVSVSSAGVRGNGESPYFEISRDGRYLSFISYASNLIPLSFGNDTDAFVRDLETGTTREVSRRADGAESFGSTQGVSISDDGSVVNTISYATDLVPGDTDGNASLYATRVNGLPGLQPGDELLIHGGFEDTVEANLPDGTLTWEEFSSNFGSPVCNFVCEPGSSTAAPRSGGWWAWFGGTSAQEVAYVEQPIRIPPGSAELRFWMWVGADSATAASLTVYMDDIQLYTISKPFSDFRAGYAEVRFDISGFADDQIHYLAFVGVTQGGITNINLDDVSLIWLNPPPTSTLNGQVTLQGRPTPPDPRWVTTLDVRVEPNGGGTPILETTVTTDQNGAFTLEGLTPGTYRFWFKGDGTLANVHTITLNPGANAFNIGTLREGDADGNNIVYLTDFSLLASSFGKSEGEAGYDARADFNNDAVVSLIDFSLLASNYGQSGGN